MRATHRCDTVHGAQITGVALHQRRWDHGLANELLWAIHIGHDAFEQTRALQHTAFDVCPTLGRDDERKQVERPRALRTILVGIHVVGDAVVAHLACECLCAAVEVEQTARAEVVKKSLPFRRELFHHIIPMRWRC